VLVKLRHPVFLKVGGALVALAFLRALVGSRNMIQFILPALIVFMLFLLVRRQILNRRRKLTALEEEYLKKRFYKY